MEKENQGVSYVEHDALHNAMAQRVEGIEKRVFTIESVIRLLSVEDATVKERIDMLIKRIEELKDSIDNKFYEFYKRVEKIESEIKEIRSRPSRMWDGMVLSLLSASIGGIVAIILQNALRR